MTNNLTTPEGHFPTNPTRLSVDSIAGLQRLRQNLRPDGQGTYSISKVSAPSGAVRAGLARRVAAIDAWHRSAGVEAARPHIDLVLGTLRVQNDDATDAEVRKKAYHLAMADLPLYAVKAACVKALRGQTVAGLKWCPQPGELHAAGIAAMQDLLRERRDIMAVLNARIEDLQPSEVERAAQIERVRALRDDVVKSAAMVGASEMAREVHPVDEWDERFAAAQKTKTEKYQHGERTRSEAVAALARMTYATRPVSISAEAKLHAGAA